MRSARTAMKSSAHLLQLEEVCVQQQRPEKANNWLIDKWVCRYLPRQDHANHIQGPSVKNQNVKLFTLHEQPPLEGPRLSEVSRIYWWHYFLAKARKLSGDCLLVCLLNVTSDQGELGKAKGLQQQGQASLMHHSSHTGMVIQTRFKYSKHNGTFTH